MLVLPDTQYRKALLGLYLCIIVICVSCLNQRELWTDEGIRLLLMAGNRTWGQQLASSDFAPPSEVLLALAPIQYQPLFFLFWNAVFRLMGEVSVNAIRLGNVALLLLTLTGLLRLFRSWPNLTRLFLCFAFALNGFFLMNVMQLREYPLYIALVTWSTVAYFELYDTAVGDRTKLIRWWCIYALLGILGYYAHSYFVFTLLCHAIFAIWRKEQRLRFILTVYSAIACVVLAALPWILFLMNKFPGRFDPGRYSIGQPQTVSYLLTCLRIGFRLMFTYNDSATPELGVPGIVAGMLDLYALTAGGLTIALIVYALKRLRTTEPRVLFAILSIAMFFAFQVTWFFYKDQLSTWPRYFIGYYFGVQIVLAFGFNLLNRGEVFVEDGMWRRLVVYGLVFTAISSSAQIYNFRRYPYVDTSLNPICGWDDIATNLAKVVHPGDTLLYYHPLQGWTLSERFRVPVQEGNWWLAKSGNFPKNATIWLLDTRVDTALLAETHTAILAAGYHQTGLEKLGCLADARRYDRLGAGPAWNGTASSPGAAPTPAAPATAPPTAPSVVIQSAKAPGPNDFVIEAEKMQRGNAVADSAFWGAGIGVLTSPSYPVWAEYRVALKKPGTYEVRIRYASGESRPIALSIDGKQVTASAAAKVTGGFKPENQVWQSEGDFTFPSTQSILRFDSKWPFPHIDKIALIAK